jgi:hypothetical protein
VRALLSDAKYGDLLLIEFKVSKKTTTGKERTNKQQRKPLAGANKR